MQSPFQEFQTRTQEIQTRAGTKAGFDRLPGQQTWSKTRNTARDPEHYPVLTHSGGALKRNLSHISVALKIEFEGETGQRFVNQAGRRSWVSGFSQGQVVSLEEFSTLSRERRREAWLESTLDELATCEDQALEDGIENPSSVALQKAKRLLEALAGRVEEQPGIYPMDERGIMIDFRNPDVRGGVLFLIEDDGSGVCFSRTQKSKGRVRVDDAGDLLSEGGLVEISKVGIR